MRTGKMIMGLRILFIVLFVADVKRRSFSLNREQECIPIAS